ncbi:hypothetical protein C8J56DRAFT_910694 [Mycena floridula]|nr:hypothetical protein C8J56DRAFT_910694 [Mycena floridula]
MSSANLKYDSGVKVAESFRSALIKAFPGSAENMRKRSGTVRYWFCLNWPPLQKLEGTWTWEQIASRISAPDHLGRYLVQILTDFHNYGNSDMEELDELRMLGWVLKLNISEIPNPSEPIPIIGPIKDVEKVLQEFKKFLLVLGEGVLDGIMDNQNGCDLKMVINTGIPQRPMLLHRLGLNLDEQAHRIPKNQSTFQILGPAGSGKTRSTYEALCLVWGFYFSFKPLKEKAASGSSDVDQAVDLLWDFQGWQKVSRVQAASKRVWFMVICARMLVFREYLTLLPPDTSPLDARRRWVLLQACPPSSTINPRRDIFAAVFECFKEASLDDLLDLNDALATQIQALIEDKFGEPSIKLKVFLDEVQQGATPIPPFLRGRPCPGRNCLQDFLAELRSCRFFDGFVISGTDLSIFRLQRALDLENTALFKASSLPAMYLFNGQSKRWNPIIYFDGLIAPVESQAHSRLRARVVHYLSGRPAPTVNFVEIILRSRCTSLHRLLTEYVFTLTGFRLSDASDLEDSEDPLSQQDHEILKEYESLGDRIDLCQLDDPTKQTLVEMLLQWRLTGTPACLPKENQSHKLISMEKLISMGIARLSQRGQYGCSWESWYPLVIIDEPLVCMALGTIFQEQMASAIAVRKDLRQRLQALFLPTVIVDPMWR